MAFTYETKTGCRYDSAPILSGLRDFLDILEGGVMDDNELAPRREETVRLIREAMVAFAGIDSHLNRKHLLERLSFHEGEIAMIRKALGDGK